MRTNQKSLFNWTSQCWRTFFSEPIFEKFSGQHLFLLGRNSVLWRKSARFFSWTNGQLLPIFEYIHKSSPPSDHNTNINQRIDEKNLFKKHCLTFEHFELKMTATFLKSFWWLFTNTIDSCYQNFVIIFDMLYSLIHITDSSTSNIPSSTKHSCQTNKLLTKPNWKYIIWDNKISFNIFPLIQRYVLIKVKLLSLLRFIGNSKQLQRIILNVNVRYL